MCFALGLALAACSGAPFQTGGGVATPVELLGSGFVRFEGRRIPTEAFLLEMRERVRSADGDVNLIPAVHVRKDPAAVVPPIDGLLRELRTAGIRRVVLE